MLGKHILHIRISILFFCLKHTENNLLYVNKIRVLFCCQDEQQEKKINFFLIFIFTKLMLLDQILFQTISKPGGFSLNKLETIFTPKPPDSPKDMRFFRSKNRERVLRAEYFFLKFFPVPGRPHREDMHFFGSKRFGPSKSFFENCRALDKQKLPQRYFFYL